LNAAKSRHVEGGLKARGEMLRAERGDLPHRDPRRDRHQHFGRRAHRLPQRLAHASQGHRALAPREPPAGFDATLAYTAIDARFTESYTSGGTVVAAGKRLPGVPPVVVFGELVWRGWSGFHAAIEARHSGSVQVNEANTDAAAPYTVANLRAGYEHRWSGWQLREFVRLDNVTDRRYAGSVIVAEARARYFEPAPGRNVFAGVEVSRAF
jgi:iron complex outermembrane receptor protein